MLKARLGVKVPLYSIPLRCRRRRQSERLHSVHNLGAWIVHVEVRGGVDRSSMLECRIQDVFELNEVDEEVL